jgi:alginate O-acetyltransferase complex protein AlgI
VSPTGPEFAYFMAMLLPIYWLMPRVARAQNAVLLAASLLVFFSWSPTAVGILLASTATDFLIARAMALVPARRRWLLAASLLLNLGELLWFKYEGFFAASLNQTLGALGLGPLLPVLHLAVPIGLSFRALQKLGYAIDVYHGRIAATSDLLAYATWVTFFPQLLAGPITRASAMLPQFAEARRVRSEQWASGAATFMLGFALKAFVAERIGRQLVDPVFASPGTFDAVSHWAALLGYAAQVFSDFAGYSIMAIGIGRVLGIELPENFNYPFVSRSLPEFWRRWHITLNAWLFDYIFVPLTTGRGWFRNRIAPGFIIVFLVSGLWHGAHWTFVLWGFLQGIGLVVHEWYDRWYKTLCRADRAWVARRKAPAYGATAWALTQGFFVLTLVPFRASSIADAKRFAAGLAGSGSGRGMSLSIPLLAAISFLVIYHLPALRPGGRWLEAFVKLPSPLRGVAYGLAIVLLMILAPVAAGTFIYAQF